MLKQRVLAAVVAVPVLLLIFAFGGAWGNLLLFGAAVAVGLLEYYKMTFPDEPLILGGVFLLGTFAFFLWGLGIIYDFEANALLFSIVLFLMYFYLYFLFIPDPMFEAAKRLALAINGLFYLPILALFLFKINMLPDGWKIVLILFSISWGNDTGGYFAGKSLGKHKLYELISPKKTWEGTFGGLAFGSLMALFFVWVLGVQWSWYATVLIAIILGAIGQIGDLVESLLKRSHGIKDSGGIIPGHGGIMDRIDALIFAAPLMYLLCIWFDLAPKLVP